MHSLSVIVFLGVLSLVFAVTMLFLSVRFSQKSDSQLENSSLNSGMPACSYEKTLLKSKFFVYAIFFIIFDSEMMLLFPLALSFDVLQGFVLFQGLLFLLLMFLSLSYAWQKDILRYK